MSESAHVPDSVFQDEFQAWWEDEGQFCRAGGGIYERRFAFQAWRHLYPMLMQARAALAQITQQRGGVVLPERAEYGHCYGGHTMRTQGEADAWNAGLDEVARLNPPGECVEYGDAYQGAREDLAIWKRRALEAEEKVRHQDQIIDHLTLEAQGETRFGEPVVGECVAVLRNVTEALRRFMRLFGCGEVRDMKALDAADALLAQQGKVVGDE